MPEAAYSRTLCSRDSPHNLKAPGSVKEPNDDMCGGWDGFYQLPLGPSRYYSRTEWNRRYWWALSPGNSRAFLLLWSPVPSLSSSTSKPLLENISVSHLPGLGSYNNPPWEKNLCASSFFGKWRQFQWTSDDHQAKRYQHWWLEERPVGTSVVWVRDYEWGTDIFCSSHLYSSLVSSLAPPFSSTHFFLAPRVI